MAYTVYLSLLTSPSEDAPVHGVGQTRYLNRFCYLSRGKATRLAH